MKLISTVFKEGEMIPKKYTCDGEDTSPPLSWSDIPQVVESLSLICDDPDAPGGTWAHWLVYNMPAKTSLLDENIPTHSTLENGINQGKNSFGRIGYGGPCPPSGTHRYYFKLYALDTVLEIKLGPTKQELLLAMEGHIIEECQLMGKYTRT